MCVRVCVWSRTQDHYNNKKLYQAARYDSYPGPMFVRGTHSKGYCVVLKRDACGRHLNTSRTCHIKGFFSLMKKEPQHQILFMELLRHWNVQCCLASLDPRAFIVFAVV